MGSFTSPGFRFFRSKAMWRTVAGGASRSSGDSKCSRPPAGSTLKAQCWDQPAGPKSATTNTAASERSIPLEVQRNNILSTMSGRWTAVQSQGSDRGATPASPRRNGAKLPAQPGSNPSTGNVFDLCASLLAEHRMYVHLGAEAEKHRFEAKNAAIPVDVHWMGADLRRAGRGKTSPRPAGSGPRLRNRMGPAGGPAPSSNRAIPPSCEHSRPIWGSFAADATSALDDLANDGRVLVRHFFGQPTSSRSSGP